MNKRFLVESHRIKKIMGLLNESENVEVSTIVPEDFDGVLDVLESTFSPFGYTREIIKSKLTNRILNNLSIKITKNDQIIGVYLLTENSIPNFIQEISKNNISDFPKDSTVIISNPTESENGLQGLALAVLSEFRSYGYGKQLKDFVKSMGYDYVWGVQDKNLKNIDFWTKTRSIFAESPNRFATVEIFNK